MILIYAKGEIVGIRADRFVLKNYNKGTAEVKIYCNGDVAFVGIIETLSNDEPLLCDELVRGLKSDITTEFKEVEV